MISKLRLLYVVAFLALGGTVQAQINYTQEFEDDSHGWTTEDDAFVIDEQNYCTGSSAFSGYAYNYLDFFIGDAVAVSPSLGASSGMPATLSFNFKVLSDDGDGFPAASWGSATIEYATSPSGPWTVIDVIDSDTYPQLPTCTAHTTPSFSPVASSQFFLRVTATTGPTDYITEILFVIDDINITQAAAPGCTSAPTSAAVVSSVATACTTGPFQLSISPAIQVSGLNIQWQSSPDNITYTNLAGSANASVIDVTQTTATWYRAIITCPNGGDPLTSTGVQVMSTTLPCYCVPEFSDAVENITLVQIATLNNDSPAVSVPPVPYEDFTTTLPATLLTVNTLYDIVVKGNTAGVDYTNYFTAYFDFNRDGDFDDDGEAFEIGSITGSDGEDDVFATTQIIIPSSVAPGPVVMRIVKLYNEYPADACGELEEFDYGQVEDYLMVILPQTPCDGAPSVTALTASADNLCVNSSAVLKPQTIYTNSGISYQWQSSVDGFNFTNIDNATSVNYTTTQTQSTWYRLLVTCGTETTPSTPIQVISTGSLCYCDTEFEDYVEAISYVEFHTLINESDPEDEENQYEDFTSLPAPVITRESSYELSVGGNTWGADENYVVAFFDWNHDGDFDDANERIELSILEESDGTDGVFATADILVPADAALGTTRMRIIKTWDAFAEDVCYIENYGQAEDYSIMVEAAAGTGTFNIASFKYYPNPVKDVLNLSYSEAISTVEVYNLVGQRVLSTTVNATEASVNTGRLAAGTYIVKVHSGNAVQAVKIVKQ